MKHMFINISADQVLILDQGLYKIIPYQDLERTFAKEIIPLVEGHTPASLLVLNGPGSFTTLRIGCLAVNLLKQYSSHTFVLYTISKLQLYQAAYQAGILPTYMGIFLGQKQNCWLANLSTGETQKVAYQDVTDLPKSAFDRLAQPQQFLGGSFPEGRLISFQRKKGVPQLVYQGKSIDCSPVSLDLTPTKKLVANYELAPTLG